MDLTDLHIFKTVVEEGGIVGASIKLHRVQSGISTRIKNLEASLDTELFYRSKQRLHLSPSGELLLGYAEQLLQLSEEARQAVSGSAPRGVFRIGALESTTASRLPGVLADYHAVYPDVRVELTTGTNDALTAAVAERRLDAAFVADAPTAQGLEHMPLFTETLVLISAAQRSPIRQPQDVASDTLIAFPHGCAYRRVLARWLGPAHTPATRVLELSSYHAIVACVASGTGIALLPESVLDTVRGAEVRQHRLPYAVSHVVTPLIWRGGEQSAPLLALRDLLTHQQHEDVRQPRRQPLDPEDHGQPPPNEDNPQPGASGNRRGPRRPDPPTPDRMSQG